MSGQDLAIIQHLTPQVVFVPGGVESVLSKIENEVRSFHSDISTKAGREAVASLAYKIARSKTALDDMGKNLVSEWKVKASAVDTERRVIRDRLDELKDEVRRPLTDWENADKLRIEGHEAAIATVEALLVFQASDPAPADLKARIEQLNAMPAREWQEFSGRATAAIAATHAKLKERLDTAEKRETERLELDRLRREQTEREQRERDEKIAREAAERARLDAEQKAANEAKAAAEKAEQHRKQIEQERAAAEARAAKAEADRVAAAAKAENDKRVAAEAAERAKEAAVAAERKRAEEEKAKAAAETAKREANTKHRAKVNNEALTALVALGLSAEQGTAVVTAIAKNTIPHIQIAY